MNGFNVKRHEQAVIALKQREPAKNGTIFYGNSYFSFWQNIKKDFSDCFDEKLIINHGLGGASSYELLYYFDQLIAPYCPKTLIWTEGANDFGQGYTVKQAFDNACTVFERAKMLKAELILLSAIETPKTHIVGFLNHSIEYSGLIEAYARQNKCFFINIKPFFYQKNYIGDANKFRDIFKDDMVHLKDSAYLEFAKFIKESLKARNIER